MYVSISKEISSAAQRKRPPPPVNFINSFYSHSFFSRFLCGFSVVDVVNNDEWRAEYRGGEEGLSLACRGNLLWYAGHVAVASRAGQSQHSTQITPIYDFPALWTLTYIICLSMRCVVQLMRKRWRVDGMCFLGKIKNNRATLVYIRFVSMWMVLLRRKAYVNHNFIQGRHFDWCKWEIILFWRFSIRQRDRGEEVR